MSMPFEVFAPEQLVINDIDMLCPAWMVLDLANLWIPTVVHENRVNPGVAGSRPLDGAIDELRTTLPFYITGYCDPDGVPYSDMRVGFRRNWRILANEVFVADTVSCTYTPPDPDESPLTISIQVGTPAISERYPTDWMGSLPIILPYGPLIGADPVGS